MLSMHHPPTHVDKPSLGMAGVKKQKLNQILNLGK
jgi:hypothetical protein